MKEPEIRFKRFEGEWHLSSYNDIGKEFKYGLNAPAIPYDGKNKYLRITDIDDETRCFMQSQISSPGTDLSDAQEYLLHEGNITFARTGASTGKSYIYHQSEGTVFFAGFLIRMIVKDRIDANFIFQNSLTNSFAQYVRFVSQRSGQPGINAEELKAYALALPSSLSEQRLIASYFQSLDTLIQATSKQLASLKQIKAASLQSMFPQEGETKPRVRFKGFEGEWKEERLFDLFIERHDISTITDSLPQLSFTISEGVIYPEDRKSNKRDFLIRDIVNKKYLITYVGDIIYNPANVVYGAIHRNSLCNGVVSPIYKIFKTEQDSIFMECIVRNPLFISRLSMKTEGTVTKLKTLKPESFLEMNVMITPSIQEQQKIGSYFLNLDRQITLQTRRLEKLKQIKAACLDKMFV